MPAFLKHIEVENFKSYKGKLIIGPLKSFTAVVGPNGSGKSNFMDAISFVMGEKTSSLRVKRFSELIHGASIGMPVARSASVTAVFELEDGTEKSFMRSVQGSSSEHRINNNVVTSQVYLNELEQLGINVKAKNFLVFQGAVESIAMKNPKERTALFEEISNSGALKAEYERLRTEMLKAEEETQFSYQKKKGIAAERKEAKLEKEEAEKYQRLKEEYIEKQVELQLFRSFHNEKSTENLEVLQKKKQHEIEKIEKKKEKAEELLKEKKKEAGKLGRDLAKIEQDIREVEVEITKKRPTFIKAKERVAHMQKKVESARKSLAQARIADEAHKKDIHELQEELRQVEEAKAAYEASIAGQSQLQGRDVQLEDEQVREYNRLKEEAGKQSARYLQLLDSINREQKSDQDRLDNEGRKKTEIENKHKQKGHMRDEALKRVEKLEEHIRTSEAALEDQKKLRADLQSDVGTSKDKIQNLQRELESISEQLGDAKVDKHEVSRTKKKTEIVENFKRLFPGVYDRMYNMCEPIHKRYNVAITKVLGKYMEAIVVDTEKTARQCIQYLKEQYLEPETFLPLDYIQAKPLKERLRNIQEPKNVKLLYDVLHFSPKDIDRAVLFATNNALVCETPEDALRETKVTAESVNEKLRVSALTEKKIMLAREEFRAVASRGSILYFLIVEMSNVNVMYQNSLKQFLTIFDNSITKSVKNSITSERINIILRHLTYEVWAFTLRSLYERHKSLFTLMLAMKIDCHRGAISHTEFNAFIKGGASLDLNAVIPKPFKWILDITWLNLVEISKLDIFSDILTKIEYAEKEWRIWYEKERPEEEELPCGYQKKLDVFRKLLLIRSWSPDRTLSQAKKYVIESLGKEYGETKILDLEATWLESEVRTPLICILSIGSDPSPQITILAKQKSIQLRSVSMGQGQEFHARKFISDAMNTGSWVLLQNVHLSLPFCTEVMDALVETETVHEAFRLWMTTEVHSQFPIGLLQMAIKFTNEPPQGIRASLKRTYQGMTQDTLDYSTQSQWPPLLYAVAFLHTVVQERRKFGPLGWNIPYEFNQADFSASVQFIQNHLDDMDPKRGVSWPTVCYMLGEVQYGGRVTDDFDKRLLTTFTHVWFCDVLLRPGFEFYRGYKVPQTKNLQGYLDYIDGLPAMDTPEVFGLHPNADITYQINTAKGILDTILSVQPKEGGAQGGETRENVVYKLATDMLAKLPKQYNSFEVKEALQRMGALLPMNIFLRQEIDRISKVIKEVRNTLTDLKLAIEGTIVMSQGLRKSLDAMYDARIPEKWLKISWESATLGFWYTELLERDYQFRLWCIYGRPKVFWMTGFFNPQGFLTAMRQEVTRAHKGWALDSVVLQNLITRFNKEDIKNQPQEGVYVHGLFLEGASLDRKTSKLIESKPKVLYEQMPVIYIYAINTTAGKDPKLYECPIYRKPQRTDSKYIGSIDFETDHNPRHWTLRGVALLCDIK